jgi:hypothetical protein
MMMVGRLSPRACLLLLFSYYLVSYMSISSAFPVIPRQQAQLTSTKQGFPRRAFCDGDAAIATLLPTNTHTTRSTAIPSCWSWRLSSSLRNQDDGDDVSSNLFASDTTTSNTDIHKQEYQAQVEELQRQRLSCAKNVSPTTRDLARNGVWFLLLMGGIIGIAVTWLGEN